MQISISNVEHFKRQALHWANSFDVCCYFDSDNYTSPLSKFDVLIAVGVKAELTAKAGHAFDQLREFRDRYQGWILGYLSYDLKSEIEQVTSTNADHLHFPDLYFFAPEHLLLIKGDKLHIISANAERVYALITEVELPIPEPTPKLQVRSRFSKEEYLSAFEQIRQHIVRGNIYVTNFCQEFYTEDTRVDPLSVFEELNKLSPTPFATFFKHYQQFILCASPERFLAKRGRKLVSQPIKGTAKRGNTETEDQSIKEQLRHDPKEQQENVMVVDLVRNDLTRSAKPGTVRAEELFGIYTFQQVHQMISTVTCELQEGLSAIDAIRNSFPMGSMTGAPKLSAIKLMEQYERSKRGVYSGAVGYMSPDDDMDLNVVIRTILYNADNGYLSFQVGSAITFDAVAAQEYNECLLKAQAIMKVLKADIDQ